MVMITPNVFVISVFQDLSALFGNSLDILMNEEDIEGLLHMSAKPRGLAPPGLSLTLTCT